MPNNSRSLDYLFKNYPSFFRILRNSKLGSGEVNELLDKGYENALINLCISIQKHQKKSDSINSFCFTQIKLKFGKLRIYSKNNDLTSKIIIRMFEDYS